MYQFTTTTIVNSNLDSNEVSAKFAGTSAYFNVSRVGKFLKDNVVSVFKRSYHAGVKEVAKVRIPTIASGLVARLTVDVRLSQQTDSEYANTYLYFKKPVTIEVLATGTAATDAAALVAQINGLKDRYGFSYIRASVINTDYIQIVATNTNQRFFSIIVEKEKASTNSIIQPEYEDVSAGTFSVTTVGKLGFGDNDWMARRITLPTTENTRYFALNQEEKPILGGNYTQYTIKYKIAKDPSDGIVAEGYSITTHVFYVLASLVAEFEAELVKANTIVPVTGGGVILITGDAALANDDTSQLTAEGASGAVTWSVVSGTSATVSNSGLVTAHATNDGTTVVKAVDAQGTSATIDIVVV